MGLDITLGVLVHADMTENDPEGLEWFEEQLAAMNAVLEAAGLPPHREPTPYPELDPRHAAVSFPYSFLHYLRRAYAGVRAGRELTPCRDGEDPARDPDVEAAGNDCHLLMHSDAEGFYVPIPFDEVLLDEEERGLPGGMLGSSVTLMKELRAVAPALGIRLENDGSLTDAEADRVNAEAEAEGPFHRELMVWIALFENARLSLAHRTVIHFT